MIAASVLILELAFIRQVPAEVRAIAYFTNLLLMAAFFGLGLGCILSRRRSLGFLLPLGLALVAGFIATARGLVIYSEAISVHYWLQYQELPGAALRLPLFAAAVVAFLCAATPFVALGQALARAMDCHPRLIAYAWDIAGSLFGTLVFVAASYLHVPPWLWPPVVGVLWAVLFVRSWPARLVSILAGALFLVFWYSPQAYQWSPYYFVQHQNEPGGLRVWSNSSFLQYTIDFETADESVAPMRDAMLEKFSRPYDVYREHHGGLPPEKVLILGAGTGNDAVIALKNGATDIVAVEIDPVILDLGRKWNTADPYGHASVRTVVDDARHFLQSTTESFDLIVFGTLDSLALVSGQGNLRLENYSYTEQSFAQAKRRLAPGGMLATYYSVMKPWLYGRLYSTVRTAFGEQCRIEQLHTPFLFNTIIMGAVDLEGFRADPADAARFGGALTCTDDWPFTYLETPSIAPVYLKLIAVILMLVFGAFIVLRRVHPVTGLHANFLFLGVGFTLMESAVIVRLALLFGGTWLVNAAVFSSVLLTIFIANLCVIRKIAPPLAVSWFGVLCAILLNVFFPPALLLSLAAPWRALACGVLIGLPVYFAAVCFSRLFERQKATGYALGMNLVGAMAGGVIEYASMAVGMRGVWVLALVVYLLAFLFTSHGGSKKPS